jgi:hypothetical protein
MFGTKPKNNDDKIVAATYPREYPMPSGVGKLVEITCFAHAGAMSQPPIATF